MGCRNSAVRARRFFLLVRCVWGFFCRGLEEKAGLYEAGPPLYRGISRILNRVHVKCAEVSGTLEQMVACVVKVVEGGNDFGVICTQRKQICVFEGWFSLSLIFPFLCASCLF